MSKISKIIDIKIIGTQDLQQLEAAITKAEQKLKNMTTASKKNAGMQKIHAKNIVDTKLKLKQLRSERNKESKAILDSSKASQKLDGSYNGLVARNKELITKIKGTTGGLTNNTAAMKKMKAEYTANNGKLKEFDKSLGNNFRNVGNYGSALGGVKEKLAATGLAIGGAVVAFQAISRVVQQVTGDFGKFEKGFTNILSLMSSADIDKFGDTLKTGAIEVMQEFGLEIEDMNKALFDAVSAGVPAADAVDFLRVASELAIGGVTDLTTATDGITTIINAFGLETKDATEVAAAFFSAQKFGKTTVEELSTTIGTVAPIAKQAGLGYKELLSAMAVLTKQGLNTNVATTALKGAIGALIKPSETAQKEFKRLGISYGVTALKGEGFMNTLKQISKAAEKDADALTALIPNVKALTGVGALGTAQLEDYDNILQQVNTDYGENSSLAAAVAMQQETLEQSQSRLNSQYTAQKVLLGEELKPIFIAVIDSLSWIIKHSSRIALLLKTGAVAWGLYKVGIMLTNLQLKSFSIGASVARAKTLLLNSALMKNPYVAVAAAILAIGYALSNWSKELTAVEKSQKNIDNIGIDAAKQTGEQISNINTLVDLAKDESNSTEMREKAVAKLNTEVRELNGNLTLENINTEASSAALKRNSEALITNAKMKGAQQKLQELTNDLLDLENSKASDNVNWLEKAGSAFMALGTNQNIVLYNTLQGIKNKSEDTTATKRQIDALSLYITELQKEQFAYNDSLTLKEIANKTYTKSIDGYRQKLMDLEKVKSASLEGSSDFNNATKQIVESQRKLNVLMKKGTDTTMTKEKIDKMQSATIEQINKKKQEYNKLLKKEIIDSDKYKAIKKEILVLDKKLKTGDDNSAASKQTVLQKIDEEIALNEALIATLGKGEGVADRVNKAQATLHRLEIQRIIARVKAGETLSDADTKRIAELDGMIIKLGQSASGVEGEDNIMQKLFGGGEKGEEAFAATMMGLSAVNDIIGARADLLNKETEERVKGLDKQQSTEMQNLKESSRYKTMTDEQKAAAELRITQKFDRQKEIIEREAFERNKKTSKQQAILSGAQAVMKIASTIPWPLSLIPIAAQVIMTKFQLDTIDKTTFADGGLIAEEFENGGELKRGGMFSGASHKNGGIKFRSGGKLMEAEGGEAIINKQSTSMFRNELSAINQAGGGVKFADGGITRMLDGQIKRQNQSQMTDEDVGRIAEALNSQEVVVTEQSISSTQKSVSVMESRMSF
mgnify:FL=1|jgi:TP901 family phage tail tape measure protein|tara:strand:+ start:19289 stop:23026 length:3738 start_codon:yes stop_codon:yes gene_type:complete